MFVTKFKVCPDYGTNFRMRNIINLNSLDFGAYFWGRLHDSWGWRLYQRTLAGLLDVEIGEIKVESHRSNFEIWDFEPIPKVTLMVSVPKPVS